MDHEQLQESLSLYALGTLEPDSAQEVEAHLAAGCPNCGTLLMQYRTTATLLPCALPPQAPPAELKAKLLAALAGPAAPATADLTLTPARTEVPTAPADMLALSPSPWTAQAARDKVAEPSPSLIRRQPPPQPGRPAWLAPALAAALGGLLAGVGVYAYYLADSADRTALAKANLKVSELERQLEARQRDLSKTAAELDRTITALSTTHELLAKHQEQLEALEAAGPGKPMEELARIFASPAARMADLHGTDAAKDAYALVFVEPGLRRGFFYANNLPAPPAGKTYQLWVITDKPISAGVFSLDRGRKGRVMLQNIPEVTKIKQFAVSLEPAGGKPQPTGSIYLAGAL